MTPPQKTLEALQKEARKYVKAVMPDKVDEVIARAFTLGQETAAHDKSMTDVAFAFKAGQETERGKIVEKIKKLLPDSMNEEERERYHCESSILFWGENLLQLLQDNH